jgi:hypothetical protein
MAELVTTTIFYADVNDFANSTPSTPSTCKTRHRPAPHQPTSGYHVACSSRSRRSQCYLTERGIGLTERGIGVVGQPASVMGSRPSISDTDFTVTPRSTRGNQAVGTVLRVSRDPGAVRCHEVLTRPAHAHSRVECASLRMVLSLAYRSMRQRCPHSEQCGSHPCEGHR